MIDRVNSSRQKHYDVYPQQAAVVKTDQQFENAFLQPHDLATGGFAQAGDADFVGDLLFGQLTVNSRRLGK